jgi:multisubunit Na+/H+ antiporter MnhB subunit
MKSTFVSEITFSSIIPQRDVYATTGLMLLMFIIGIIIIVQILKYKKVNEKCAKVQMVANVVLLLAVVLVASPLVLLFLNISGNYKKLSFLQPYENIVRTQFLVFLLSIVILILLMYLKSLKSSSTRIDAVVECQDVDPIMWNSALIFVIISGGFLAFRYYADKKEEDRIKQLYSVKGLANYAYEGVKSAAANTAYFVGSGLGSAINYIRPKEPEKI